MNANINVKSTQETFFAKNLIIRFICFKAVAISLILSNFAVFVSLPVQVHAQVPIVITADQPNVWTLEQAHYLLAQMHRRNLDLKAKGLTELDANAINGVRLDILKTLLEVGVEFSQEDLFNNRQAKSNTVFNNTRRQALTKQNDELRLTSLQLTQDISILNSKLKLAQSEEEKAQINAEIEQKTAVQARVDKEIAFNYDELKTLNPADSKVAGTSSSASFNKDKQGGMLDESFKAAAKKIIENADKPPQLNATLQLDNYLQLQYEIISKQLTLLRDEVGPGERLLFLELPQSINASYDRANNKWAQSWWKVRGYTKAVCNRKGQETSITCPSTPRGRNNRPRSTSDFYKSIQSESSNDNRIELYGQYKLERSDILSVDNLLNKFKFSERYDKSADRLYELLPEKTKTFLEKSDSTYQSEKNKQINDCSQQKSTNQNNNNPTPCPTPNPPPPSKGEELTALINGINWIVEGSPLYELNDELSLPVRVIEDASDEINGGKILKFNRQVVEKILGEDIIKPQSEIFEKTNYVGLESGCLNTEIFKTTDCKKNSGGDDKSKSQDADKNSANWANNFQNRQVRTVELIPRQSSLNVNDIKLSNKAGVFNIIASFLFGLGANVNYQRQREQYSQFVQQELYSSAFGKGSTEFGWTFTPMPGTDRISSGVRTTYAVVIVPKEATSVMVESTGCYFRRSDSQPENFTVIDSFRRNGNQGCGVKKTFVLPIPGGGDDSNMDFYISGLTYQSVKKGKRVVVSIYGENFSSQIGVLVNATPLKQSVGLAQPFILDDSKARKIVDDELGREEIKGSFERIDSNQIIATFSIPEFEGTPTITLVAPGAGIDINRLKNLYINGNRYTSLSRSEYMFGRRISESERRIDSIEFYKDGNSILRAFVYGSGFSGDCKTVYFNSSQRDSLAKPVSKVTPNLINASLLEIPSFNSSTNEETLQATIICGNDILKSSAVKNPAYIKPKVPNNQPAYDANKLRIENVNFISYEGSTLVVELQGIGFTIELKSSVGDLVIQTPTNATLMIPDFKATQAVTFTDEKQKLFVKKVITRTPQPVTNVTKTVSEKGNN